MSHSKDPSRLNQLPNVNRTWEEIISSSGAAPMAVSSPAERHEAPSTSSSQVKTNNHNVHEVQNVPISLSSATEHNDADQDEDEGTTSRQMPGKRPIKRSSTARDFESDYSDSLSAISEDDEEYHAIGGRRSGKVASRTPLIKGEPGDRTIFNSRPADVERLFAQREAGIEGEQPNYDFFRTEIPKPLMEAKVAMAGRHLYVCYQKSSDKFEVRIYTERCRYKFVGGTFYSLSEAVRSRNIALKEAGRDPPPNEQTPEESDAFIEQVKEDLGFFNDGTSKHSKKTSRRTNYEKKYAKMLPKYISVKSDRNIFRVVLGIDGKRVNVGNYKYLSEAIAGRDQKLMELGRSIPDTVDEDFNLVKFPASRKTPDPKIYNNTQPRDVSSVEATPVRRSGRKRAPKRPPVDESYDFAEDTSPEKASKMPAWMSTAMNPQLETTIRQAWWSNPDSVTLSEDPTHPGYWKQKSEEETKEFFEKVSADVLEEAKKHPILERLINNYAVKSNFV
eukprot:gb/GECG01012222.1/.p1 GENE.gb/GECG01012222.1/~~gb/GECG01012222.1/.p1  ORF type:complete len:504 (+),score=78.02 gb/GECG01012222.1/:1-1512(+)